jgi:hypothetical protein
MTMAKCEHHFCRCMRAEELAGMGRTLDALRVHRERVTCRLIPKEAGPDER